MKILVIHETVPRPDRAGCDVRLTHLIGALCRQGHDVTFISRSLPEEWRYVEALQKRGVRVFAGDAERLRAFNILVDPKWSLVS